MAQREEFVIVAAYWRPYLATENDDPNLGRGSGDGVTKVGAGLRLQEQEPPRLYRNSNLNNLR